MGAVFVSVLYFTTLFHNSSNNKKNPPTVILNNKRLIMIRVIILAAFTVSTWKVKKLLKQNCPYHLKINDHTGLDDLDPPFTLWDRPLSSSVFFH